MGSPGRRIRAEAHMQVLQGTTGTVSFHLLTVPERILKLKEIVMILRLLEAELELQPGSMDSVVFPFPVPCFLKALKADGSG